jgi:hypothetical protein
VHASAKDDGTWACGRDLKMAPGCGEHLLIPALLATWAEPLGGEPDWILYRAKATGRQFVNATASSFPAQVVPHYSSRELVAMTPQTAGDPVIESARTILGGEVVQTTLFPKAGPGL